MNPNHKVVHVHPPFQKSFLIQPGILFVLAMLFNVAQVNGQQTRRLNTSVYKHVVKPNTPVEVNVIENGKVKETETSSLKDVQIVEGSKMVVSYEKDISIVDAGTYAKILSTHELPGEREDFKILPELHIKKVGNVTESFSIAFTLTKPFQYSYEQNNFNTSLSFFLIPESDNNTTTLLEPIYLEVVSSVVNIITPEYLNIPHINLPTTKVALIAERVSDSVEVRVITASKLKGYPTFLKVEPALEIFTNKSSMQGYGIQTIPVEVRFIGSNSPDSVKVNFSVSKGSVEPGSMYVKYNEPSTIYVRSEGTGQAILSAITTKYPSNSISFTYTFPWPFLLFSMIGGLIGGLIKHYFNAGTKTFPVKPIVGGILIGFVVAVAYYFLGINLIGLNLNATLNEIAVLGLSALGAYFGISNTQKPTT